MPQRRPVTAALFVALLGYAMSAQAWTINTDIQTGGVTGASYIGVNTGSNDLRGASGDGGNDAFDNWGYYNGSLGGLSLNRHVDALTSINTYRWLDTFTNNTASSITATIRFYGDYGSDGQENFVASGTTYRVSRDPYTNDPMISAVWGNNAWAASHMAFNYAPNQFNLDFTLTLAAGASTSLLFLTALTRPDGGTYDAVGTGTQATAIATAQNLVNNPYLTGLSTTEINRIVNFDTNTQTTPEPSSFMLLPLAMAGFFANRRRKTRAQLA